MTLFQILTRARARNALNHDLGPDYVEESIDSLSNYEFLEELSAALEEVLESKGVK